MTLLADRLKDLVRIVFEPGMRVEAPDKGPPPVARVLRAALPDLGEQLDRPVGFVQGEPTLRPPDLDLEAQGGV